MLLVRITQVYRRCDEAGMCGFRARDLHFWVRRQVFAHSYRARKHNTDPHNRVEREHGVRQLAGLGLGGPIAGVMLTCPF